VERGGTYQVTEPFKAEMREQIDASRRGAPRRCRSPVERNQVSATKRKQADGPRYRGHPPATATAYQSQERRIL
jgi:hypothetical protein